MVDAPVEIEHVNHIAAEKTVDYIADYSSVKKWLGYRSEVWKFGRFGGLEGKDRASLPNHKRQRDEPENCKRPDLPLEHPPRTTAVLNIGEVEEVRNNLDYAGAGRPRPPQITTRQFLCDSVDKNEIRDGRKQDEEAPHCSPRSIALWHSMHVRTNGWLMRRGLRIS